MKTDDTPKRQWLDMLAMILAVMSLGLSGYTFYYSDVRLSDDLKATILSLTTLQDTNGFPIVRIDSAFRNEGNRPALIRQVRLSLSESPTFDLPIHHFWNCESVVIVEPRSTLPIPLVFGDGLTNNPIIISRGYDEPTIYARLVFDVIDSRSSLHRIEKAIGSLRYANGLHIHWKDAPPWQFVLLPSDDPPPYIVSDTAPGRRTEVQMKIHNYKIVPTTNDGPLAWRLVGAYTNDPPGSWAIRPIAPKDFSWRIGE